MMYIFENVRSLWIIFVFDRFVKRILMHSRICPSKLNTFVSCRVSVNRGISWSLFADSGVFAFYALTIIIALFLAGFAWYTYKREAAGNTVFAETLVLIGGTSNLFDRLIYGGVVDFIHLSYGNYSFPIFNFSDVCIVLGVVLMMYHAWYEEEL